MEEYLAWILERIRQDESLDSWLEEIRFDFARTTINTLASIEDGVSILVCSDTEYNWFVKYVTSKINSNYNEPFIPFIDFNNFFPNFDNLFSIEQYQQLSDMLDISFPNGYIFWYIGDAKSKYFKFTNTKDNSLLWLNEEHSTSGIYFEKDDLIDKKLLDGYNLFYQSIMAKIYGEIEF
jgi:hypothetical protein